MPLDMLNLGFGNTVVAARVGAVVAADSAPVRRLIGQPCRSAGHWRSQRS